VATDRFDRVDYKHRFIHVRDDLKIARLSRALAAQRAENAQDKQTIVLLTARIESLGIQLAEREGHARVLYLELQEVTKDAAKFRFLYQFFENEASVLASRVDALSAAGLAAEKKEFGARVVEFLFGWFFAGGRRGPSHG